MFANHLRRVTGAALAAFLVFEVLALPPAPALAAESVSPRAPESGAAQEPSPREEQEPAVRVSGQALPLALPESLTEAQRRDVTAGAQRLADLLERDLGPISSPGPGAAALRVSLTWTDWPSFARTLWGLSWRDVPGTTAAALRQGTPDSQGQIIQGSVDFWLEEALVRANLESFETFAASLDRDRQVYGADAAAAGWYRAAGRLEALCLDDMLRSGAESLGAEPSTTAPTRAAPSTAAPLTLGAILRYLREGDDPDASSLEVNRLVEDYLGGRLSMPLSDLFAAGPGGWPAWWGRVRDQDFATIGVWVDGRPLAMDVPPAIENGRTLVPLRAIFEALGAGVDYDDATRRITAEKDARRVTLWPDDPLARIDSRLVWLDAAPRIADGRTLVPARFVSEALGAGVEWVDATRTVVIHQADAPLTELLRESEKGRKVAYLTFDDGPSKEHTAQVLDILARYGVKATFFLIGRYVKAYPKLARREAEEGHSLGNHTYDHDYKKIYASSEALLTSAEEAEQAIYTATGVESKLFRAPGGSTGNLTRGDFDLLHSHGYAVFDWNVSTADSTFPRPSAADILTNVDAYSYGGKTKSVIILMHDGAGHASTIEALPEVIRYLVRQGYLLRPLTPDSPLAK